MSSPALPISPTVAVEPVAARARRWLWLHCLLFLLTLVTTSTVGACMQMNFDRDLPFFDIDRDLRSFWQVIAHPAQMTAGLPFSLTLLTILLAHEFGHYVACLYYGIDASLPFFIPFPTITGTLGAFIRIRSAIYSKRALFDIGIAGPIAGFVFLVPALTVGLAFSKVIPGIAQVGDLKFGTPALLRFLEILILPGVPTTDIYLHPIARAAWVGMLATAMNLLPIGQLDGGHILYALASNRYRAVTRISLGALALLGYFWPGWLVMAAGVFVLARRHPAIYDLAAIGRLRIRYGVFAVVLLLLCFTVVPTSP